MKKIESRLFPVVFVLLICAIASGTAFAQDRTGPPCCFISPTTDTETAPVPVPAPVEVAQDRTGPPCCFISPTMDTETAPVPVPAPIELAQDRTGPPCCFLEPSPDLQGNTGIVAFQLNSGVVRDWSFLENRI